MSTKHKEVLETALDKLEQEIKREPLSPEGVTALTGAIEVLVKTNPLEERVAALERQLAGQPIKIVVEPETIFLGAISSENLDLSVFQNLPKEKITRGVAPSSQCILSTESDDGQCSPRS